MAISFWIWDVAHRGVVDPFSSHKNFPPFSRSLPPFSSIRLSIGPLFKSPIFVFFSIYILSSFKSSRSSSSSCPCLCHMQWFQVVQTYNKTQMERKEALRKTQAPEKTRGKARSWMGIKEWGRFSEKQWAFSSLRKQNFSWTVHLHYAKQNSGSTLVRYVCELG